MTPIATQYEVLTYDEEADQPDELKDFNKRCECIVAATTAWGMDKCLSAEFEEEGEGEEDADTVEDVHKGDGGVGSHVPTLALLFASFLAVLVFLS